MIVFPKNWNKVGRHIGIQEIDDRLRVIINGISCNCLSLSGGVDSSLLFYYMCLVREHISLNHSPVPIICFTAARPVKGEDESLEDHPDVTYSKMVVEYFRRLFEHIDITHYIFHIAEDEKDNGIRLFYEFIAKRTNEIIAGDGIDEFMGGYYEHQQGRLQKEKTYYSILHRLQKDHLTPLNKVSGDVRVYLPYLDEELISLYGQIPLMDKVDLGDRKKVILELVKGKIPDEVITRRKYGFCDVS